MNRITETPLFYITLTCVVYAGSLALYRKSRLFFLHPVLVSVGALILFLTRGGISYEAYMEGARHITIFLGPAVVALAVPLYREFEKIRKEAGAVLITALFGSLAGILSAVTPAVLLGSSREIVISLAPKSVTSPIAMGIAERLGGLPPLSAAVVIAAGIFGAVTGPVILRLLGVTSASSFGLAMGFSSHGIGTARALEIGGEEGAFSSLGLCLNGLITAGLTPVILRLLGIT